MSSRLSLRATVTLAALGALALSGIVAGALLLAAVGRDARQAVDRDLAQRAPDILRRLGGPPERGPGGPGPGRGNGALLEGSGSFVQVAANGRLLARQGDVPANPPDVPAEDGLRTITIDGAAWRSLTMSSPDGVVRAQVLSSLAPVEDRVGRIRTLVIVIGLGALALTALAAWGFTTLAVRPLRRLQASAARVSGAADLATALPEDDGPIEVRSLARTLNEMLERLRASTAAMERALAATRRFAADAGHELRTPLTSLRANLDALERNPDLPLEERLALVRDLAGEQERMVHLLEGLQALARGDAAERIPREPVELHELADAALYAARRRHPAIAYELVDGEVGEATILGWPDGLRLLLDNLLDNAALHGRAGGRVRLALSADGESDGGGIRLRVEDDGPGIPEAEREQVLEPFARGAAATASGTGLGLAIVAQQVALHGGRLALDESPLGGLAVDVRL